MPGIAILRAPLVTLVAKNYLSKEDRRVFSLSIPLFLDKFCQSAHQKYRADAHTSIIADVKISAPRTYH